MRINWDYFWATLSPLLLVGYVVVDSYLAYVDPETAIALESIPSPMGLDILAYSIFIAMMGASYRLLKR